MCYLQNTPYGCFNSPSTTNKLKFLGSAKVQELVAQIAPANFDSFPPSNNNALIPSSSTIISGSNYRISEVSPNRLRRYILKLPRELRDLIYQHICDTSNTSLRCVHTPLSAKVHELPQSYTMLLVNHQLAVEFASHVFAHLLVEINFTELIRAGQIADWTPPQELHYIHRLTIKIEFADDFAHIEMHLKDIMRTLSKLITGLSKLKELELVLDMRLTAEPQHVILFWLCVDRIFAQAGYSACFRQSTLGRCVTSIELAAMHASNQNKSLHQVGFRRLQLIIEDGCEAAQLSVFERGTGENWLHKRWRMYKFGRSDEDGVYKPPSFEGG
ncbi:hypothetical protein EJ08DRAFT_644632 [Tothia fuscella]|uniref:Uncharacterized protein n=1 Tax=Tothia fuscella TaxID=1048955 RepID=A0A9P4P4E2_9PEZI|nr:hypothetical protein EJ08DRAFT_644632 [Tothia fuscella]